jgi:hypothetical protein
MAGLSKMIDVHSRPIFPFGKGAPVGAGHKQPDRSVECALSYMEAHDVSACVLSDPDSANHATGQEARDIARRINETLADIVSRSLQRRLSSKILALGQRRPSRLKSRTARPTSGAHGPAPSPADTLPLR